MTDINALRLNKINFPTKKGNFVHFSLSYISLFDTINECANDYPSNALLDSYDHGNTFHGEKEIAKPKKLYKISSFLKLVKAEPGDHSCQWKKDLFMCIKTLF